MNPFLVKDVIPGSESSNPLLLGNVNGELLFATSEGAAQGNPKLWKTDGTKAGTVLVEDDFGIPFPTFPRGPVTSSGSNFFFFLRPEFGTTFLYKTDGTAEGTFSIFGFDGRTGASFGEVTDVNGSLFASSSEGDFGPEGRLLKFDNNTFEPIIVKDNFGNFEIGGPTNLTNVNGTLYLSAADTSSGETQPDRELWKSDGTNAGTVEVKDINPGSNSSNPENLTDINGKLFFTADDGSNGRELWKSDGTQEGTVLVKDIVSGSGSSDANNLTDVNGKLFFTAEDGSNGRELWKSDGTQEGTVLVKDILTGHGSSTPDKLTNVDGTLFFTASNGDDGVELWKSDGTKKGTVQVKDIRPGSEGSSIDNLTNVDGTLYFTANDGTNGTELWKSDGTAEGTTLVGDIRPGSEGSNPTQLTQVDGTLYFSADDGVNGTEVWAVDTTKPNNNITFSVSDGNSQDFNKVPGLPNQVTIVPSQTGDIELPKNFNSNKFPSIVAIDGTKGTGGSDFPAGTAVLRDGSDGSNDRWNFSQIELKNIAYIDGGDGSDRIIGSQGGDNIFGGANGDNLRGRKGDDTIEGGTGNDIIRGQDGNDLLLGETKGHPSENDDDILDGGAKNDILDGQNGDDVLIGGAGKDKFVLSGDFDRDFIADFVLNQDRIINTSDRTVKDVVLGSNSDSFKVSFNGSIDILTVNINGNDQGELQSYLLHLGSNEALPY